MAFDYGIEYYRDIECRSCGDMFVITHNCRNSIEGRLVRLALWIRTWIMI